MVLNWIEEKLNSCGKFVGKYYKDNAENMYTLLVQQIGTTGPG